ncbi:MAG TPA: PaaI family thioesterase [Terriglobales bacterium]|nr:PaaI family thioesterase [Terriglobales bacterium]
MTEPRQYALASLFGPATIDMIGHTPHAKRLRMRVIETGPAMAVITLPYHEELVGDPSRGVIFGGAITTLLDHASGLCVACALPELTAIATIDLRVDYLRAAQPEHDLFARTECYKVTRNVAFVRGTAWEHDAADPFATSHGTFMLGANPSEIWLGRLVKND